jgi:hypothetical protein
MTRHDVPGGEMPRLPFPRRPGEPDPDELLRAQLPPGDDWQSVSEVLRAAAAPATPSELAGQAAMMSAFRRMRLGTHGAPSRHRVFERPRMLTAILSGKIAAALAAAAVAATGAATAAYAGVLPDSVQTLAHHLIAAPAPNAGSDGSLVVALDASGSPSPSDSVSTSPSPSSSDSTSASPSPSPSDSASPSATVAPEAFGLCNAWSNAVKHGLQDQVGFRDKLVGIAKDATAGATATATATDTATASPSPSADANQQIDDAVTAFCGTVKHPGADDESPEPSDSADAGANSLTNNPANSGEQHGKSDEQHGNNGQGHRPSNP